MKHAAEILVGDGYAIYSEESATPTGTYHWARSKNRKPPTLRKITRIEWYDAEWGIFNGERKRYRRARHVTIWKHGWHHIKGARKGECLLKVFRRLIEN